MNSSFQKLAIQCPVPQRKRLASNVFKVKTDDKCLVYKYFVSLERIYESGNETKNHPIKNGGPEALRIIRARITRAALHSISSRDRFRDKTFFYDAQETVYSNAPISDVDHTEEVSLEGANLSYAEEHKRSVLHDSKVVRITFKPDAGNNLSNIQISINECDREEPNLIKFFASIVRSAAPEDEFICLRAGRLFDIRSLKELPSTGMLRGKGIKMGTKLIGKDQLSVSFDIDSKEGTFFKPQPLMQSICDKFKCSLEQLNDEYANVNSMKRVERFIRDMTVREEGTDRVFSVAGLKWGENKDGEKFLQNFSVCNDRVKLEKYGFVPIVVEENVFNDGRLHVTYSYYPINSLHTMPFSKVSLPKQDRENRPPALPPSQRHALIDKARGDIRIDHQNEILRGFLTNIDTAPVFPTSEILSAPSIYAGRNGQNLIRVDPTKHSYNTNQMPFVVPARISTFTIIHDYPWGNGSAEKAKQFGAALVEVCKMKGMEVPAKIACYGLECGNEFQLKDRLESGLQELGSQREKDTKNGVAPVTFVLCLGFLEQHDLLKFAEHKMKVITQHVMKFTMDKVIKKENFSTDKTLHNIAKKVNEKCGGTNMEVRGPMECSSLFPLRADPKSPASLIIGMDVCHGDPLGRHLERLGHKPDPSIIGISSNALTANPQMYTGEFIATQGRKEAVPDTVMQDHGKFLTRRFYENHGRLPDNVVLVRDGVARSQYEMALGEFSALMEGVNAFAINHSKDYNPREVLIIATKDHNLRLFDKVNGKICNPQPGTVVDSDIVSPFLPEFLIIPHDAFSGTAQGTLVTVLKDGTKDLRKYSRESMDEIKYFIHSLCFLHGIADLPPGLPEPVSAAHDLAERGHNIAKQNRFYTGDHPSVDELNRMLNTRGTSFEGVKFTA